MFEDVQGLVEDDEDAQPAESEDTDDDKPAVPEDEIDDNA